MNPRIAIIAALALLVSVNAWAGGGDLSAQDNNIIINPVVRQFPVTTIGDGSAPAQFTVSNLSGVPLEIGTITRGGTNPDDYEITGNSCTPTPFSLGAGGDCTVSVSFKPSAKGTRTALLLVPSSSATTPVISAYLTNSIGAADEAQQRMPPTLASVTIPDTMTSGTLYTISWTLEGYDANYQSSIVLFDCTGVAAGSCGNDIGDAKVTESPFLSPDSTTTGNWSYGGVLTKKFTYSWPYTPLKRSGGADFDPAGTDVVVRFYQKSDIDAARNKSSVSLLIPGNQGTIYYDTAGRRILVKIQKAAGP